MHCRVDPPAKSNCKQKTIVGEEKHSERSLGMQRWEAEAAGSPH